MSCAICRSANGRAFIAREMMFGTREPFDYFACDGCGCVTLASPPPDLSRYYPPEYHAFAEPSTPRSAMHGALRRWRNGYVFGRSDPVGRLLALLLPYPVGGAAAWFRRANIRRDSRILDVGCGAGTLLHDLADAGFSRLSGIDPFVPGDMTLGGAGRIQKGTLAEVVGEFDLVMLHHSLEHMKDQLPALSRVAELLAPGGVGLIRIPIASSWAWSHYREHWVQLDAPRHYVLHSVASLQMVAEAAGLRVDAVVHDSTELQFAGSELYRRARPLSDLPSAYTRTERRRFRARARQLNAQSLGDQASFYVIKAGHSRTPVVAPRSDR